ncbi:MAG: hypothetical protein ACLTGO_05395 [Bifidobacterium scardovii]
MAVLVMAFIWAHVGVAVTVLTAGKSLTLCVQWLFLLAASYVSVPPIFAHGPCVAGAECSNFEPMNTVTMGRQYMKSWLSRSP